MGVSTAAVSAGHSQCQPFSGPELVRHLHTRGLYPDVGGLTAPRPSSPLRALALQPAVPDEHADAPAFFRRVRGVTFPPLP